MSTDHQVLGAIAKLQHQRAADISAFIISQEIEGATGKKIGYGTLHRSLSRLEDRGVLKSRWECPRQVEDRPRRKFYSIA